MTALARIFGIWRGMIGSLLACALVLAPLAAQAKMAQHSVSHAAGERRSHDHDGAVSGPVVALVAHDHSDHNYAMAHNSETPKTGQQHDHREHHDGSCCGTYCHSACTADIVETMLPIALTTAYPTFTPVSLRAVAPDQPQRPPSIPLSI